MVNKSQIYIIVLVMSTVFFVLFGVSIVSLYLANDIVYDLNRQLISGYSYQVSSIITEYFDSIFKSFSGKSFCDATKKLTQNNNPEDFEKLTQIYCGQYSISGISLYDASMSNEIYASRDDITLLNQIKSMYSDKKSSISKNGFACFYDGKSNLFYMIFPIYSMTEELGHIRLSFDTKVISDMTNTDFYPFDDKPEVYFMTPDEKTFISVDTEKYSKYISEAGPLFSLSKDKEVFISKQDSCVDFQTVFIVSASEYTNTLIHLIIYLLALSVALLLITFLILVSFTNNMFLPLRKLNERMKSAVKIFKQSFKQ